MKKELKNSPAVQVYLEQLDQTPWPRLQPAVYPQPLVASLAVDVDTTGRGQSACK